jgi:hypothetical protein
MKKHFCTPLTGMAAAFMLTASTLYAGPPTAVVIGTVDQAAGQAWLKKELLLTKFGNGDPIEHLLVRQYHDGYHLLRIGKNASGGCRSESIPLKISGSRLVATEVHWFVICDSPSCDGFCTPNANRSGCDCFDEEALSGPSDLLNEFDVENSHRDDQRPLSSEGQACSRRVAIHQAGA